MTERTAVRVGEVTPPPTEDEMAAIVAAVTMAWPRPAPPPEDAAQHTPAWRFSGRWWARPVAVRRARPW
ncbi:MAG TPA: hypothetical protein VMK16_15365 [Acidimicrobiales bacterium]|nr:hypothetical protein [Acidimicrobiales bacterium]